MKKVIRITIGVIFIAGGLAVVMVSFTLFPQPFSLGEVIFAFAPIFLAGVGLVSAGLGVIAGISWREIVDNLLYLWH